MKNKTENTILTFCFCFYLHTSIIVIMQGKQQPLLNTWDIFGFFLIILDILNGQVFLKEFLHVGK